jgi:Conserved TM helix
MHSTTIAMTAQTAVQTAKTSLTSALNTVLSAVPRLLGFGIILLVGWVASSLVARGLRAALRPIRFDDLARRSGFADFVRKMGVRQDSSEVIASIAKWFVRLITLVVAFDMLRLPAVSGVLQQLLLWLPNLVAAVVVLVVGGLAADALSHLVRGAAAEAALAKPDLLARITRGAIWAFAIVVAVNQIGIAPTLINTLLIGLVGAAALAAGLAFGLAGRDRAARILDSLGSGRSSAGPRPEPAVARAGERGPIERSGVDRRRVPRPGGERRGLADGLP